MASSNNLSASLIRTPSDTHGQEYFPLNTLPSNDSPTSTPGLLSGGDSSTEVLLNEARALRSWVPKPPLEEDFAESAQVPETSDLPIPRSNPFDLKDWQWECAAAALSLVCSAAIVGVLLAFENKTLGSPQLFSGITLNTLVAILSTLSRTALLVPIASCISQLKWIYFIGATHSLRGFQVFEDASRGPWGSLTLIWKLNLNTKLAIWGSFITILTLAMGPFTQQLLSYPTRPYDTPDAATYVGQVYYSGGTGAGINFEMERAIVRGIYSMGPQILFSCPNGNCHWDELATLAVSNTCKDVTSDPKTQKACDGGCVYETPSGFTLAATMNPSNKGVSYTTFNSASHFNATSGRNDSGQRSSTIAKFAMLKGNLLTSGTLVDEVVECQIQWCARILRNTAVVNGTFNPGTFKDLNLTGIVTPSENGGSTWNSFNVTEDDFPGNRTFSVFDADNNKIIKFLSSVFSSTTTEGWSWVGGATFGVPLSMSVNLTETVDIISDSMTYAVRQGQHAERVEGQSTQQYIHVTWPWITIPLAEVVMGIAFLICTLIYTKRRGVTAWKSSSILPLLTAMDGWDGQELRTTSWRDIDKRSEGIHGVLVPSSMDIQRFVRSDS